MALSSIHDVTGHGNATTEHQNVTRIEHVVNEEHVSPNTSNIQRNFIIRDPLFGTKLILKQKAQTIPT